MNTFTRWASVDRSPTPTGWARPGNLMPAVGPSSWPRGRRAMTEAEEILATAEAWWDVDRSGFRDGDRYLRNIGTAGSVLDLRLGSSGVANSNDPKWLGPEETGYVYLPGSGVNRPTVPTSTSFNVTDLDIRAYVNVETWRPSAQAALAGRYSGTASTSSWYVSVNSDGTVSLFLSNGSAFRGATSTVAVSASFANLWLWVRATYLASTGEVVFYTSPDGSTWTQLGTTRTVTTGAPNASTEDLAFGSYGTGYTNTLAGRYGRFLFLNGINGTTVLDVDADAITSGAATTFTATTGQTVTINRATSGRKSVAMPSRAKGGRPLMLLGTDDYLECQGAAQHGLLNFGQGDSFTVLAVARKFGSSTGVIICKQRTLLVNQGWSLNHEASTILHGIHDGIALNVLSLTNTLGAQNVVIATRQDKVLGLRSDSTSTTGTQTNAGDARSFQTVRVGNQGGAGNYGNFEFYAAAIFRRALTAREISVIANAAPWGV